MNKELHNLQALANNITFVVNRKVIERVGKFKYLRQQLSDKNDNDMYSIIENVKKIGHKWNCLALILKKEGANVVYMA